MVTVAQEKSNQSSKNARWYSGSMKLRLPIFPGGRQECFTRELIQQLVRGISV